MRQNKYYFQVNKFGDPIPGSNIRTTRPPRGLGQMKWKEFKPTGVICCDSSLEAETSVGKKVRYYVRLDQDTNLPVSGTLMKAMNPPRSFHWQEVVGAYCCGWAPEFELNPLTINTFDPTWSGDILSLAAVTNGITAYIWTTAIAGQDDTTFGIPDNTGTITVDQDSPTTNTTNPTTFDVVTTDGHGHHTTLQVIFNYENLPVTASNFTSAMAGNATLAINIKTASSATDPEAQAITIVESGLVSGDNGNITLDVTNQSTGAATMTYVSGTSVTTHFTVHLSDGVNTPTAVVITATHN